VKQQKEEKVKEKKQNRRAAKPAEAPHKTEEATKPAPGKTAEKWITTMIQDAVRQRSDAVHIEQQHEGLTVRFRVDGTLRPYAGPETSLEDSVLSQLKKMSRMKTGDERVPRDGRFGAIVDSREVDFRVHSLPTSYGESLALRLLDRATLVPMTKLGLQPDALAKVREMMGKPRGLILVAGPAVSGKTTTLYAMLSEIAKGDKKVVSLEYPIEFDMPNVIQSQIDPRSGYDYPTALRVVTRQDPDVVMVGGLGDADTARAALETVLGGHVVLSSIHASDAAEAITRLLGMGVDPYLLGAGLEGIIEQRVLRRVCPSCKQMVTPSATEREWLGMKPGQKIVKGSGCPECKGSGYKGRVGVFAVLPVTEELRDLLPARPQPNALRQFYRKAQRVALIPDGMAKVKAGLTTFDEVIRMGGYMPSQADAPV